MLAAGTAEATGRQTPQAPPDAEECLACHSDKGLTLDLPNGERRSLHVDLKPFMGSVHQALRCADCHAGMVEFPHPEVSARSARELTVGLQATCRKCHFTTYTKTLDSVHAALIARGKLEAPVCTDCHGAHDTRKPGTPRSQISHTCARCHGAVSAAYTKSVHGRALIEQASADVPVCTDCHRSHDIADPRPPSALLKTPELCGSCHANERMMQKYGLSTKVLQTYLSDFHGVTASLQRASGGSPPKLAALCIDCHGVHNISRVDAAGSPLIRENLLNVCRRCHPSATENFPAAWLSHYEPSWERAPLVYGAKMFYVVFIPFVIGGLALQILLHLWRMVVNR
jgi:predicted CXXCH cytochrome family protein